MGFFASVSRALGSFRSLSDTELEDEYETLRQRWMSRENPREQARLREEMYRYNDEITRRANAEWDREDPNPQKPPRREHGWYLSGDD